MTTYQQRISFKGSEDSIDYFTKLLRDAKEIYGANSADILLSAAGHWLARPLASPMPRCTAQSRAGCSRIFYLQILTSAFVVCRLNSELERLRRDPTLRLILEAHRIGRQEFLLEALIIVLEFYKSSPATRVTKPQNPDFGFQGSRPGFQNENSRMSRGLYNDTFRSSSRAASDENRYISRYTGSKSSHQLTLKSVGVEDALNKRNCTTADFVGRSSSVEIGDRIHVRDSPEQHLVSWRKRLREQQLAENRKLTESIRSRSSASRQNSVERNSSDEQEKVSNTYHRSRSMSRPPLPPSIINHSDLNNNNVTTAHSTSSAVNKNVSHQLINSRPIQQPAAPASSFLQGPRKTKSRLRARFETLLNPQSEPIMTLKERNKRCDILSQYLNVNTEENRIVPGFCVPWSNFQRTKEGIDCDEVYPGIILGNGATLRCKDYLRRIGITHILNAAEYTGVNVDETFFKGEFHYMGLRVEDTPQTQICRYFLDVAEYIDEALLNGGKVYVNCVFGKSRSTSCILAYLLLAQNWDALKSLEHIRRRRPVKLNFGFLQQIADLESKLTLSSSHCHPTEIAHNLWH